MIGIISDTHWPPGFGFWNSKKRKERAWRIKKQIKNAFADVEFIIHAGDVGDPEILDFLEGIARVYLVKGNRDPAIIRGKELPKYLLINYKGKKIAVTHGWGSSSGIIERAVDPLLLHYKPDIIIFGHTHRPFNEYKRGTLYINPGSAADTIFTSENFIATLEVTEDEEKVNFIKIII